MRVREQIPPLKVIRAFDLADGSALVHLHNVSGGILGGDNLSLEVNVEADAGAQITTTSATRIYRQRPETAPPRQYTQVRVERRGLLELLPDPLIPFAGSWFSQATHIDLADDAGLFWWEIVTPGRTARGEVFAYEMLDLETAITANGRPIALEHARYKPSLRPLTASARFADYRYSATFYICRVGIDPARWLVLETELNDLAATLCVPGETVWGASTLVAHGVVVRALSVGGRTLPAGLLAFWRAAKRALYDREPILPRKVY